MSSSRLLLDGALCSLGLLSPAHAEPISPVVGAVTRLPDGQYRYDYTVTNTDTRADHIRIVDPKTRQMVWWDVSYSYFGRGGVPGVRYFYEDDLTGPLNVLGGYVVGPTPTTRDTPEPTSGILMGVGCLVAGSCLLRRRRTPPGT